MKITICHFFKIPFGGTFRWDKNFWQRIGQNDAIPILGKRVSLKNFDTVELVAFSKDNFKNQSCTLKSSV